MRALLISPELGDTYWGLRESVSMLGRKVVAPPLGLITVAAMLPKAWKLRLVNLVFEELTEELWSWSEIVILSGMRAHKKDLLRVVQQARARHKTSVVGGPYATMAPDELIQAGADFVFRGEAEGGLEELLHRISSGSSDPVVQAAPHPELTASPIPRFDLLGDPRNYAIMGVQTTRGCPFECEFCDVINLHGRRPRHKTPEQVISELDALHDIGWRGALFFCDDNFIGSKAYTRRLLDVLVPWIKSHGEPFNFLTQASVNLGQDRELIDLMTDGNFSWVFLGIETPDEEVLKANRKHQNVTNPLLESVTNICANGLSVVGSFVIGFDGEKPGADERIIEFVNQAKIPMVMINRLEATPGTALWKRLKAENRLIEGGNGDELESGGCDFVPTRPREQIAQELTNVRERLYDPSEYMRRAYQYYLTMRPTRKALGIVEPGSQAVAPRDSLSIRNRFGHLRSLLILVWRRGIASRHRWQFWAQLYTLFRRNPSRTRSYLNALGFGESLYPLRNSRSTEKR
ncbi:MAG: radical SAM protein [Thermodesulfobacteriota bacterium]